MPRKPRLPAAFQRAEPAPAAKSQRRSPDPGREPGDEPGKLWDKFRPAPVN